MALKLTGPQKAAFFVMSLNPKTAKELMGKLGIQEKDMIRRTTAQIKKASLPIFLKMWETFKRDVQASPSCETPWPDKNKPPEQTPATIPAPTPKPEE